MTDTLPYLRHSMNGEPFRRGYTSLTPAYVLTHFQCSVLPNLLFGSNEKRICNSHKSTWFEFMNAIVCTNDLRG